MATQNTNQDPEAAIENAIGRTEAFLQKNGKLLLSLLAVIVVVVGGYFGYKYLYVAHRAEKAGGGEKEGKERKSKWTERGRGGVSQVS